MKKITFKQLPLSGEDDFAKTGVLNYREHLMSLLLIPEDPQAGTNYEEMTRVLPIHTKFREAGFFVLLEDAEHKELVKRLKNAKFVRNIPQIYEMINDVVNAPEHLMEAEDGQSA